MIRARLLVQNVFPSEPTEEVIVTTLFSISEDKYWILVLKDLKDSEITDFGLFIGLHGDIDGLIHLSDISWDGNGEELLSNFKKGENVIILDQNNIQIARGLSSFSSVEIDKIKGKQSKEIEIILGYLSKSEVIHKDDMVLL